MIYPDIMVIFTSGQPTNRPGCKLSFPMDQAEVHFDVSLVQQLHLRVAENKEVFVEDVTNRRGVVGI